MSRKVTWIVAGDDETPDGYRDHLLYEGTSWWGAFRAILAARREGMKVTVTYR